MSTGGFNRGARAPPISTILNDPNANNGDDEEDDAALVDSFFLPGGLFSDESSNYHSQENKITESKHYPGIDSISLAMTTRSPSTHLPQNPWEPKISSTKITEQSTKSSERYPVQIHSRRVRPLHLSLSSTSSNDQFEKHMGSSSIALKTKNNINHLNLSSPHWNKEEENTTATTINEPSSIHHTQDAGYAHANQNQESILHGIMANKIEESSRILRPPPGFRNGLSIVPPINTTDNTTEVIEDQYQVVPSNNVDRDSIGFLATNSTSTGTGNENFLRSSDDRRGNVIEKKDFTAMNYPADFMTIPSSIPKLSDGFQQHASLSSNDAKAMHLEILESHHISSCVENDKYEKEEKSSYPVQYLRDPSSSTVTADPNREGIGESEVLEFPILVGSKGIRQVLNSHTEDKDDDADAEIEDDDTEENSIPSSIFVSVGIESSSSSLSTYSEVDNNSELSSHASGNNQHINDDHFEDEGVGYDTDQAHVSQILGVMESVLCSSVGKNESRDDNQSKSSGLSANSNRVRRRTVSLNEESQRSKIHQNKPTFSMERMTSFFRYAVESCNALVDHALSAIRMSPLYVEVLKRYKNFTLQIKKISRDFHNFANWLIDVEEVVGVFLKRLMRVLLKLSICTIQVLAMISLFLFQLLKFGFIEAIEEFDAVTSCYLVLYLLPRACVTLMRYISLPHWTPHSVTWLAIFVLSRQVEAGKLRDASNLSISSFVPKKIGTRSLAKPGIAVSNTQVTDAIPSSTIHAEPDSPTGAQHNETYHDYDKHVCCLLLNILKAILPVLVLLEGFSSDFGTVIGGTGTDRLTRAFVLSVLRKSVLTSPIFWISWAVQVLLAAHCSPGILLDALVLLTGLSSIRLIRYIDFQQAREAGWHVRSKKQ